MKNKRLRCLLKGAFAFAFWGITTVAGSCSKGISPAAHGELAQGSFQYDCVDPVTDPVCENLPNTPDIPFQIRIAEGAEFILWFVLHENVPNDFGISGISSPLSSVLERVYDGSNAILRFLSPEWAPVHATNASGQVHDFVHIKGEAITSLMIAKRRATTKNTWGDWDAKWEEIDKTLVIAPGELANVRVFPLNDQGNILSGTIRNYEWTPPDVAAVASNPNPLSPTLYSLSGVATGSSTLAVSHKEITHEITVVVEPASDGGLDGGNDGGKELIDGPRGD